MRKIAIFTAICILIFMMFSISYGFWTDQVEIAGDSKVSFKIKINKDIELEEATDAAIKLNKEDLVVKDVKKEDIPYVTEEETATEEDLVDLDIIPVEEEVTVPTEEETSTEDEAISDEPNNDKSVPLEEDVQSEETSGDIS